MIASVHLRRLRGPVRHRPGFTIIEMIVVVGIVFLLISMLLPALSMARSQANTVKGLANLDQIGSAIFIYTNDNKQYFPVGYHNSPGNETDWAVILDHYVSDGGMTNATNDRTMLEMFRCPNASNPHEGNFHYSTHPVLMPDTSPAASPLFPEYRVSRIRRGSEMIIMMDGAQRVGGGPAGYTSFATAWALDAPTYMTSNPWFSRADVDNDNAINPGPNNDDGVSSNGTIRWRQQGDTAGNFLFTDGHASTLKQDNVLQRNIRVDR